jgi:Conserved TM helix
MKDLIVRNLSDALMAVYRMTAEALPRILAMAIIIFVGWIVAWVIEFILRRVLVLARLNRLFENKGFTRALSVAALPSPAEVISRVVFWIIWVSFILVGINALGVVALQKEVADFVALLPQFVVALLIIFFGFLAANFLSRAALLAAVNANSPSPKLVSSFVRFLILLLAITMALERVGLGRGVVLVAFAVSFGAIMMGLAIAFGLGGRHVARRILERRFAVDERRGKEDKDEEGSHL